MDEIKIPHYEWKVIDEGRISDNEWSRNNKIFYWVVVVGTIICYLYLELY